MLLWEWRLFTGRPIGNGKSRMRWLAVVPVVLYFIACKDLGSELPASGGKQDGISFRSNIEPILSRRGCESCHGGSGGLFVSSVALLLRGGDHGPAIVPGSAETSLMIKKLSPTPPFGDRMPQGGAYLSDSTIQVIKDWINEGAPDN